MRILNRLFLHLCLGAVALLGPGVTAPRAHAFPAAQSVTKRQAQAQDETAVTPLQPMNCESLAAYFDDAIIDSYAVEGAYLIVIARPGSVERSENLSRSRLANVEQHLKRRTVRYRTAVGSRVKGLGQIEIYVGGKLVRAIQVKKNSPSACEGQVNPFIGE
jgi:hypothetical protein